MRRTQRYRTQEAPLSGLALPDDWPGERLTGTRVRRVRDGGEELLVPDWIRPEWASWTRVILVGRDPWGVAGLRHLLARCGAVRLRVLQALPADADGAALLAEADVVVWLRLHGDGMPELSGMVAGLRRRCPWLRQLVISDALPRSLAASPCALSGVWTAHGRERCEFLYGLLAAVMAAPPPSGPLLSQMLNRSQWRVLLLRASGLNTKDIATACGTGYKTVSVHESAIRERLGIVNRVEYAWLLRCVKLILAAVPGLLRGTTRTGKAVDA